MGNKEAVVEGMESQVTNLYRRAALQPRSSCVGEWLVVMGVF